MSGFSVRVTGNGPGELWLACFEDGSGEPLEMIVQVEAGDTWASLSEFVEHHYDEHGCSGAFPGRYHRGCWGYVYTELEGALRCTAAGHGQADAVTVEDTSVVRIPLARMEGLKS